ncbi:MAG: hypothetical protein WD267_02270 [Balneolales bacterium]
METSVKNNYNSYRLTISFTESVSNNELLDTWIFMTKYLETFDLIRPKNGHVIYTEESPNLMYKGFIKKEDVSSFEKIRKIKKDFSYIDKLYVSISDLNPDTIEDEINEIVKELDRALS